jgi:hypothetical protein
MNVVVVQENQGTARTCSTKKSVKKNGGTVRKMVFFLFCSIIHIDIFSEEGPSELPDNVITKGDGYT